LITFRDLGISDNLLRGLSDLGILSPTEIQEKAIPILLKNEQDFIGLARTGTGKTAAFGLPLLQAIEPARQSIQALVLAPTRELGQQLAQQLNAFAKYQPEIRIQPVLGGAPVKAQIKALRQGVHVVVATPGRLLDLLKQEAIDLRNVRLLVLDEADEMLNMGFTKALDDIMQHIPGAHSSWLFSATMPAELKQMTNKYLSPKRAELRLSSTEAEEQKMDHRYLLLEPIEKLDMLMHFLHEHEEGRGIIFCRTKASVQKLSKQLISNRFSAAALHGDLPQGLRDRVMDQFREQKISILVASDVAARGIDVADLSFIIHYHIPELAEVYTHRSGRTARAGKSGSSLTFVFPEELPKLQEIEQALGIRIKKMEKPKRSSIESNQLYVWAKKILKTKPDKTLDKEIKQKVKDIFQHLSKDELIERLLTDQLKGKSSLPPGPKEGKGPQKK
jgi:ATP-dependent RNA helicase DeaD